MSYALGAISLDKTPGTAVDLVKTWAGMKDELRSKLGEYKFADGSLRTFNGVRCPMLTVQYAVVIHDWLARVAAKMIAKAQAAGRPTSGMSSALSRYNTDFIAFRSGANDGFGGRMPLESCYAFINATDAFAIALSAAQWAAFNNGTPLELLQEALNETPGGGLILGAWNAASGAARALSFLATNFMTIAKVGAAAYLGFFLYKRMRR